MNRKKGKVATVDIKEIRSGGGVNVFISQVADISCADTALRDSRLASHKTRNTAFFNGLQIERLFRLKSRSHVLDAFLVHNEGWAHS